MYTMEYYCSVVKKNKITKFVTKWVNFEKIIMIEITPVFVVTTCTIDAQSHHLLLPKNNCYPSIAGGKVKKAEMK